MGDQGEYTVAARPPASTNGLGLAGFVCALVGLCSGGVLSPIGLILSLVALKDQPKGFAIAGVILGALGSCGMLLTIILAILAPMILLGALGAAGIAGMLGPQFEAAVEMGQINAEVQSYLDRTGALPLEMDDLGLTDPDVLTDPWGNPYEYELSEDGQEFRLYSRGPDGQAGTGDDIDADPDVEFDFGQK